MRRQGIFLLFFSLILSGCSVFSSKSAGMRVTANIPATVRVDDKVVGETPFQANDYKVKKYTVTITPGDTAYQPHQTSIKLLSGYLSQIDWNFASSADQSSGFVFEYETAKDKNKAELQLTASPDNVPVSVDGKNVGFTPLLLDTLSEGNHSVVLQAPGYEEAARTVKLTKGSRTVMTTKLAKKPIVDPTPLPLATASATLETATAAAKKATPKPTVQPSPKPSSSPAASASGILKKTTTVKPYVEILTTETGFLRVRSQAGTTATSNSSPELAKLAVGSTVPYANASASGWLKVTYDGTATGWVSGQYSTLHR